MRLSVSWPIFFLELRNAQLSHSADVFGFAAKSPLLVPGVGHISPEVEMEKFVEISRKDKGFDKENSWYGFCEKQRIPFITIKVRSKLADVQWDYMPYPPSMDKALFAQHERIKTKTSAIYKRYASKDTWFGAGPGVISFGNLDIDKAREVATELYDIIVDAVHIALDSPQTER